MKVLAKAIVVCGALWCVPAVSLAQPTEEPKESVLIQGSDVDSVLEAVCAAGGEVTHQLGIINAVGARMTRTQIRELEASDETLRVRTDRKANVDSRQRATTAIEHTPTPRATQGLCQRTT